MSQVQPCAPLLQQNKSYEGEGKGGGCGWRQTGAERLRAPTESHRQETPLSGEIPPYSGNSENPVCGEDTPIYPVSSCSPLVLLGVEGGSGVKERLSG